MNPYQSKRFFVKVIVLLLHIVKLLDNLPQLIDCALNLMMGLAEGLINAIPVLIEKAPEIILKLLMALEEEIPKILQTAWNLIKALAQGLWDAIQLLLDMVATIASKIANAVLATPVGQWAKSLVEKFITAFQVIVSKIKKNHGHGERKNCRRIEQDPICMERTDRFCRRHF